MTLSQEIKNDIKIKILSVVKPVKIVLFGSYASGEATEDSDLDLLIIEDNFKSKVEEKSKIRQALKDIKIPKDILVIDKDKFDFYKNEPCSVYRDAYEKGEVLWSI